MDFLKCSILVLPITLAIGPSNRADEIGYKFTGTVFQSNESPWGISMPLFAPVTGALIYDLGSVVTHELGECDCVGYRQQRLNGFFAKFGNHTIRADEYVVEVLNNLPQGSDEYADVVSARFSSNFDPPLEWPIVAGGVPRSVGSFSVNFLGPPDLFTAPALPTHLEPADYTSKLGFLSDTVEGVIDIVFSINSLKRLDLLPGDYDLDNDVDIADYNKWNSTFGSTAELVADGNLNGVVDAADYTIWRDHLGATSSSLAILIVPEPKSAALFVLGVVSMMCHLISQSRSLHRVR